MAADPGGHAECLRRRHGGAAGTEPGSSSAERITVNAGTIRAGSRRRASSLLSGIGASAAERAGWGGAAVVVRGRESRSHGEGRQRFRGGKEAAMPQDAPPNGSAPGLVPRGPWSRVAGMQAKLHRWAAADPGRRFDDLFNLVHDPATLAVAFARVAGNQGADTPGVDGLTAAYAEEGSWATCGPPSRTARSGPFRCGNARSPSRAGPGNFASWACPASRTGLSRLR
jgi:hypothetical protein